MRMIPLFRRTSNAAVPDINETLRPAVAGSLGQQLFSPIDPASGRPASVYQANVGSVNLFSPSDAGLATVSMTYGYSPGVTNVIRGASVAQLSAAFTPAQVYGLVTAANLRLSDGVNLVSGRTATDAADDQATLGNVLLASIARLQGWDGAAWDRLRTASAAALAANSAAGALLAARPGDWSVTHAPAANTQATITRAAGAAGVRHVCTSISASLCDRTGLIGIETLVTLRDGASAAGTVLWSRRMMLKPDGASVTGKSSDEFTISGLNIVGSAATAMTLEFAGVAGAGTFESVAMTGYDAPG